MPNASWPSTLPQFVTKDGYGENLPDQTLESPVDVGEAKIRQRYTAANALLDVNVRMTKTQLGYFKTFFITTLAGGSLPFDWVHPLTQAATTFVFRKPAPSVSLALGQNVVVKMRLEARP